MSPTLNLSTSNAAAILIRGISYTDTSIIDTYSTFCFKPLKTEHVKLLCQHRLMLMVKSLKLINSMENNVSYKTYFNSKCLNAGILLVVESFHNVVVVLFLESRI